MGWVHAVCGGRLSMGDGCMALAIGRSYAASEWLDRVTAALATSYIDGCLRMA